MNSGRGTVLYYHTLTIANNSHTVTIHTVLEQLGSQHVQVLVTSVEIKLARYLVAKWFCISMKTFQDREHT